MISNIVRQCLSRYEVWLLALTVMVLQALANYLALGLQGAHDMLRVTDKVSYVFVAA